MTHNIAFVIFFLIGTILISANTITDSVFIAYKATKYDVAIYTGYSIIRLSAPFLLVALGVYGIFISHIAGVFTAVFLSFYYMVKKLNYKFGFSINKAAFKQMWHYSIVNYVAAFLWSSPLLIFPLIIINKLGARDSAYFYFVLMIINILFIIPTAITQSLFAEGSHAEEKILHFAKQALKFAYLIVVPAIIFTCVFGGYILAVFGHAYAANGTGLLRVLAVATLLVVANMVGNSILKVEKKMLSLIIINALCTISTLALSVVLIKHGLIGVGWAFFIGQVIMVLAYLVLFILRRKDLIHRDSDKALAY